MAKCWSGAGTSNVAAEGCMRIHHPLCIIPIIPYVTNAGIIRMDHNCCSSKVIPAFSYLLILSLSL